VTTDHWPRLPAFSAWEDTCATLHRWLQVVGKIRLRLGPWHNHSWGSALYVTTSGLTTSPMPYAGGAVTIDLDFTGHALRMHTSAGARRSFALEPMSVATFYRNVMRQLDELGVEVALYPRPVEVEEAVRFDEDEAHASYDAEPVHRFWSAMLQASLVFQEFRAGFAGKASPVHVFWGAFDLAVTRFSGRPAPPHPGGAPNCADWVMREAYSHEVSSAGFWPGAGYGEAAFYSYAYPAPPGFAERRVRPEGAGYHAALGEFLLPYEAVRTARDPRRDLLAFLQSTYEAAADLAAWNRRELEYRGPVRDGPA